MHSPAAHLHPGPVAGHRTSPPRQQHALRRTPHRAVSPHCLLARHANPGHHQDGAAFTFAPAATHSHRYFFITSTLLIGGSNASSRMALATCSMRRCCCFSYMYHRNNQLVFSSLSTTGQTKWPTRTYVGRCQPSSALFVARYVNRLCRRISDANRPPLVDPPSHVVPAVIRWMYKYQ